MPEILVDLFSIGTSALSAIVNDQESSPELLGLVAQVAVETGNGHLAQTVAYNQSIDDATVRLVLEFLATVPDRRRIVGSHPRCPYDVLITVLDGEDTASIATALSHHLATSDLLDEYASHDDTAVRCAVAANPNTRPTTVGVLAFDGDVSVRANALGNHNCPPSIIIEAAAGDPVLRWPDIDLQVIAEGRHTPDEALPIIAARNPDLLHKVLRLPQASADTLRAIVEILRERNHVTPETADRLAMHQNAPFDVVEYAAIVSPNGTTVGAVLAHPEATAEHVNAVARVELGGRGHPAGTIALSHPLCDPELLIEASQSCEVYRRVSVAENPGAPAQVLDALASDTHPGVRKAVAANPATPAPTLQAIAGRPVSEIQQAAMRNPRLPALYGINADTWTARLNGGCDTVRQVLAVA